MAPLGVALIGAGMIAPTHMLALSELQPRCTLKTIVSRRPERAKYLSEYYEGTRPVFTSDLSVVLEDADIKFVIVATPPSARLDIINSLANAGKHILLEKPVARDLTESKAVVEMCETSGIKLGLLFQHRMRNASRAATSIVTEGKLGKLGLVEISVPLWRPQSYYDELDRGTYQRDGGGVLITQGIHTIDLALSLTGPVSKVQAMTVTTPLHTMEAEDFAVVGLKYSSGAVGSLVASTATYPHGKESITLHGENGSLHLCGDGFKIHWRDSKQESLMPAVDSNGVATPKTEWHKRAIENFIDAIEHDVKIMVSGNEALASHQLIDAIEDSSRRGCAVEINP